MIKNKRGTDGFVRFAACALILNAACSEAQTPADAFYAGGPDDYEGNLTMSETWTINELLPNAPHVSMNGKKFTLRKNQGDVWFLDPAIGLGWGPNPIRLEDYPDWEAGGATNQWRWVSVPPVRIDNHNHKICIGFPVLGSEPRRDDDKIRIAVVDSDDECEAPPDEGSEEHPGHADAGR
jgi:hypothetical protein